MVSVGTANCTIDNLSILPTWYVCFVHLSQRMSIISVISIKKLDFVTDVGFVLCEAETELMCMYNERQSWKSFNSYLLLYAPRDIKLTCLHNTYIFACNSDA